MGKVDKVTAKDPGARTLEHSNRWAESLRRFRTSNVPQPDQSPALQRRILLSQSRIRCSKLASSIKASYGDLKCVLRLSSADPISSDEEEVADLRFKLMLEPAQVLLYWADGSLQDGFLGAGVAALEHVDGEMRYTTSQHELGFDTGYIQDAELFAIVAALGLAKRTFESKSGIQVVRVYSDALAVLESLERHECTILGPLIAAKTALEALYQRTEWLDSKGVVVELVWVKGHNKSKGNKIADRCANEAVRLQKIAETNSQGLPVREGRTRLLTQTDVPVVIEQLGQEWSAEWLCRANRESRTLQSDFPVQHKSKKASASARKKLQLTKEKEEKWRAQHTSFLDETDETDLWDDGEQIAGDEMSSGVKFRSSKAPRVDRRAMHDIMAKRYAELDDPEDDQVGHEDHHHYDDYSASTGSDADYDEEHPFFPHFDAVSRTNEVAIEPTPERWVGDALVQALEADNEAL